MTLPFRIFSKPYYEETHIFQKGEFNMFGKIASAVVAAELVAIAIIGGLTYSEYRYHKGREDMAKEIAVEAKFRELTEVTLEGDESTIEEA